MAEALQAAFRTEAMPSDLSLAAFRPALGKVLPQWASPDAAAETSFLLIFEGLVRLLSVAARAHGALVVLEDLHWADADTVSAVEYLAEQLAGTRCLCVVTARSDEPSAAGRRLVQLADRSPGSAVRLRRLDPDETAEMARRCIENFSVPEDVVALVAERAGGVPLLVEELLTAHVNADGTGVAGLPESYAAIVQRRLSALNDQARTVIDAAAVVGLDADPDVLGAVTGLEPGVVRDALRAARDANLLVHDAETSGRLAFRHALVADAVLARLLPMERRDLYRRVAADLERALPGLPGVWCERVADLRERGDDPHGAFTLLTEAGRRALRRGALLTAEQTLSGLLALMYAATHPERTGSLTLLAAAPPFIPELQQRLWATMGSPRRPEDDAEKQAIEASEGFARRDPKTVERYFVNMYLPFFRDRAKVASMDMGFTANTAQNAPAAWERTFADLEPLDPLGSLTKITCPTLVVHCELDPVPEEFSRLLADKIAGARYAYVRGVNHFAHHEDPEQLAAAVKPFLRQQAI